MHISQLSSLLRLTGMPTAFLLAFHYGWGLTGLWTGHVTGLVGLASLTTFFAAR